MSSFHTGPCLALTLSKGALTPLAGGLLLLLRLART
jgi:hypothetical protein